MDIKQIRRAQTISPFGVGSILDIDGQSLVAADITYWRGEGDDIFEERLQRKLGVTKFKMAPSAPDYFWDINENSVGVPYVRFPTWYFCPYCRSMCRKYSHENYPVCERCSKKPDLTPMRFVTACPNGHLSDVPWVFWAHSYGSGSGCKSDNLEFRTSPGGSGLEFVFVICKDCGAKRNLRGIADPDSLKKLKVKCSGHHPWISWGDRDQECNAIPQVLQRGATNLTFTIIESSIDIPPYSDWNHYTSDILTVTNSPLFIVIRNAWGNGPGEFLDMAIRQLAAQEKINLDKVDQIVKSILDPENEHENDSSFSDDLYSEEYQVLINKLIHFDNRDNFIKRDVDLKSGIDDSGSVTFQEAIRILASKFGNVSQITKLREVRALKGFSRLSPPDGRDDLEEEQPGRFSTYSGKKIPAQLVPADLGKLDGIARWLPAIEVYGEGIFFSLNEDELREWENRPDVVDRVSPLISRCQENASYLPEPNPRSVLLHTLSHILIRQLSFECGYSIASLRERIYAQEQVDDYSPMAGILIYTASGDSEGTMGGLVRMGETHRFFPAFLKALQVANWCSSDPLCRESTGQGLHALNLAACHSCCLLPETSCTMSNRLLDRVLLFGNDKVSGFFTPVIDILTTRTK